MAVITGSLGSSATNAKAFYDLIAAQLVANGHWTLTSDSPLNATDSGGVASNNTYVWKCDEGADFYVAFEVIDTGATPTRLRIRAAEAYDTTAHDPNQPCAPGTAAAGAIGDSNAVTPTANATVTDTPIANWAAINGFWTIETPASGFFYLFEVRNHLITMAVRNQNINFWVVIGQMESLVTRIPDVNPLFSAGQPSTVGNGGYFTGFTQGDSNNIYGVVSRTPGKGGVSTAGAFCIQISGIHYYNGYSSPPPNNMYSGLGGPTASRYHAGALTSQAVIHGSDQSRPAAGRLFRGYLPGFICTTLSQTSPVEPQIGDQFIVDTEVYWFLGTCNGLTTSSALSQHKTQVLAIKA